MNELIAELANHCDFYVGNEHSEETYQEKERLWLEKFAELVVRECCDIFVELRTRPADLVVKDVKKHFGVEE